MNTDDMLKQARETWGGKPMTLEHIALTIGVVYGDMCRQARAKVERGTFDENELKKELGNLITSSIRWCDDLGFDYKECIRLSQEAQARYKKFS